MTTLLTGLLRSSSTNPLTTLDLIDDFVSGGATSGNVGALGWLFAGGTITPLAAEASHPGIVRRDTSATINTLTYMLTRSTTANGILLASDLFDLTWVFRLNTNDTDTKVRLGLSSGWDADAPVSAIYLEKKAADTEWFGCCRAASVESRTAALATVDTGWHKVRIRRLDATTIGFTLDAGAEVALATNVPGAVGVQLGNHIHNAAAAAKTLDLDFVRLKITGLVR